MRNKFATLLVAALLLVAGISAARGRRQGQQSGGNQEKIRALDEAYRNGLMTQQEYEAKLRELNGAPSRRAPNDAPSAIGPMTMEMGHFADPNLGMDYARMPVPSDWIFQGGVVQWTSCNHIVSEFYRATSADGLSGVKSLPRLDIAWADDGSYRPGPRSDCMGTDGPMRAEDYLRYMIGLLNVHLDQVLASESGGPGSSVGRNPASGTARAVTDFKINNIEEEETISVFINCFNWPATRGMHGMYNHSCTVTTRFVWAPKGRLPEVFDMVTAKMGVQYNPAWLQLRNTLTTQQTQALVGQIVANGQAFRAGQDVRFQQHEELMHVMQRGSDMNYERFKGDMNAKQQMADDTCDALLGQQKRYDPSTGQFYKTDSAFTYDWVNSDGQTHRLSRDINFNPNGMGDGTWTLTRNVR